MIAECRSKVLQNASKEHSAILLTFIKLPFVVRTFVLSICEWPFQTGLLSCCVKLSSAVFLFYDTELSNNHERADLINLSHLEYVNFL